MEIRDAYGQLILDATGVMGDIVTMTTAGLAPVLPYLMLVLILIFRPRGLFGTRDV